MNIFNIILQIVRNSFGVLNKLWNTITSFIPKIFNGMILFIDFLLELFSSGIATIIEFINEILRWFGL